MSIAQPHDAQQLASIASEVAVTAGERILELRRRGVAVAASKSSEVDIVTEADRESEQLVVDALRAERPDDGVLGEEGAGIEGTSGVTWVIDPIDGTVNYLYDLPAYTVSIAATVPDAAASADGRRAIAGAVFNPRTGELFEAWEGGGSRLNGSPVTISGKRELSTALVGTGFGYTAERRAGQAAILARLLPRVRDIRRTGSAAYEICSFAAGRLDAFYEHGLQPWDYAAALLIAREAGASVIGIDDAMPPGEPGFFAADPELVHELRRTLLLP